MFWPPPNFFFDHSDDGGLFPCRQIGKFGGFPVKIMEGVHGVYCFAITLLN